MKIPRQPFHLSLFVWYSAEAAVYRIWFSSNQKNFFSSLHLEKPHPLLFLCTFPVPFQNIAWWELWYLLKQTDTLPWYERLRLSNQISLGCTGDSRAYRTFAKNSIASIFSLVHPRLIACSDSCCFSVADRQSLSALQSGIWDVCLAVVCASSVAPRPRSELCVHYSSVWTSSQRHTLLPSVSELHPWKLWESNLAWGNLGHRWGLKRLWE